jgi:hypothetical protein
LHLQAAEHAQHTTKAFANGPPGCRLQPKRILEASGSRIGQTRIRYLKLCATCSETRTTGHLNKLLFRPRVALLVELSAILRWCCCCDTRLYENPTNQRYRSGRWTQLRPVAFSCGEHWWNGWCRDRCPAVTSERRRDCFRRPSPAPAKGGDSASASF